MRVSLIVMLVLGFILVIVIFALVSQRKAVVSCNDANRELDQKLQETLFALRQAESKQTEDTETLESQVKEQTKEIDDLKAQFEEALSRKNAHVSQLTQELQQYNAALQQASMQIAALQQAHATKTSSTVSPEPTPTPAQSSPPTQSSSTTPTECNSETGVCEVPKAPPQSQPSSSLPEPSSEGDATFPSHMFGGQETTVITVGPE